MLASELVVGWLDMETGQAAQEKCTKLVVVLVNNVLQLQWSGEGTPGVRVGKQVCKTFKL